MMGRDFNGGVFRTDNERLRETKLPIYLRFPMALHKTGKVNLGFELAIAGNLSSRASSVFARRFWYET